MRWATMCKEIRRILGWYSIGEITMNVSKVLQSVYVKFKKNIKRNSDLSNKVFDKVAFDVNKENGHGQN